MLLISLLLCRSAISLQMKDAEGLDLAAEYANHNEKAYKDLKSSVLNAHGKTANKNHA